MGRYVIKKTTDKSVVYKEIPNGIRFMSAVAIVREHNKLLEQLEAVSEIVGGLHPLGLSFHETQLIKAAIVGEQ
jgi:hypothetical protein